MWRSFLLAGIIFSFLSLNGQDSPLQGYIEKALESNLKLKQKQSNYRKSTYALKEAKGLFYPKLSFNARYSVAEGGRTVDLPVGEMLNPVYASLNQITTALAENNLTDRVFPPRQIDNEEIEFLRPKEHETKLRLSQPIFNTDIYYNSKIKEEMTLVEQYNVEAYKRQLVSEVQTAYFNYLKTLEILEHLENTKKLIKENIRVNRKLFENDKVTKEKVYRAQTELKKWQQKKAEAVKSRQMARAYFNFLLNRDLNAEIESMEKQDIDLKILKREQATQQALQKREELKGLETYNSIADKQLERTKSNMFPTLNAVVDYGFQGSQYEFNKNQDFVLASVILEWNLFHGRKNQNKIEQARLEKKIVNHKQEELRNQIRLEVINAYYDLKAAGKAVEASRQEKQTAKKAFRITQKKYQQGKASLLELIDARNSMTEAGTDLIINQYRFYGKYAQYERVAALYPIHRKNIDENEK